MLWNSMLYLLLKLSLVGKAVNFKNAGNLKTILINQVFIFHTLNNLKPLDSFMMCGGRTFQEERISSLENSLNTLKLRHNPMKYLWWQSEDGRYASLVLVQSGNKMTCPLKNFSSCQWRCNLCILFLISDKLRDTGVSEVKGSLKNYIYPTVWILSLSLLLIEISIL